MSDRQWAGTTFGNGWMHRSLIRILRHVDVRVIYLFSDIFVVPVCLILNGSRRTSYRFYRDRLHYGVLKACWATYRNHCCFSQVVIDRFAMYAGRRFDVTVEGLEHFNALASKDEGFIHLSSHIGNYEIAGYSLVSERKKIHAVVYSHEKESVMQNRNGMFSKTNISMIALKEDMSHLYEIDNAICKGDIVSFPTDRHMGASKCLTADFFGKEARFPMGPFSVATMRGVDVLAVNVMKEGLKKYRIFVTPLQYDRQAPRREQTDLLCRQYVEELERRVRQYPLQWYNFFDFWA